MYKENHTHTTKKRESLHIHAGSLAHMTYMCNSQKWDQVCTHLVCVIKLVYVFLFLLWRLVAESFLVVVV